MTKMSYLQYFCIAIMAPDDFLGFLAMGTFFLMPLVAVALGQQTWGDQREPLRRRGNCFIDCDRDWSCIGSKKLSQRGDEDEDDDEE
jgi:hypothetical protein